MQELQLFAWQSEARGNDVHLNANPTQGQLLHEAYKEKKEELRDTSKVSVLAKYGGEEHLAKPPKELLLGQTEEYVEYSRAGQVIHGKERAKTRSKYPEDGSFLCRRLIYDSSQTLFLSVYINNHTSVWGSWYETASSSWGYGCCHSTVHISYCTGEAGKQAARASSAQNLLMGSGPPPEDSTSKSSPGGGDKGKQRKTDVDVGAEQGKLSDERKRRARANEGDERFSKKSKNEEAVESKKFDVSEDELGMDFVQDCVGMVNANECTQRDTVVRRVGWRTRWRTMLMAGTCRI